MFWIAWGFFGAAAVLSIVASLLGTSTEARAKSRNWLIVSGGIFAVASLIVALLAHAIGNSETVPRVLAIAISVVFAISYGGPFTELVFSLATKGFQEQSEADPVPSPLRGGLWIGLLERTAIVASLWSGWPEGLAIILAVKGLGRFAELKNHQAAEQFILGTFASGLVAAGAYGLGVALC